MTRVLVAGVGNVFFGDDGFGVAVARHLLAGELPASIVVRDIGIRGLHLAYDLLEAWDLLVFVDAVARGGTPGTLHVIQPTSTDAVARAHDAHGMDLRAVLDTARALGASPPPVVVVGCDVADVAEGMDLTPHVEAAVPEAARLVLALAEARNATSKAKEATP